MGRKQYHFKFEDLEVYQRAMKFGERINSQIREFPDEEKYRLASQFIRAADSIALNIAEGSSASNKNFIRYLQMAWFSVNECVSASTKAKNREFITAEQDKKNRKELTEISRMISGLIRYLRNK